MAEVISFHGVRYDETSYGGQMRSESGPAFVISDEDRERLYARGEHNAIAAARAIARLVRKVVC